MNDPDLPIRAAVETAAAHGIAAGRRDVLQNGSTLVVRLTETLVARVVQDRNGPRQGTAWFARENAVAEHLTRRGAPVIPLHPDLPPGPHEHLGFPLNFWEYVTTTGAEPDPAEVGRTLYQCHVILRDFSGALENLAILTESLALLDSLDQRRLFPAATLALLRSHLERSITVLDTFPSQPLHGDAHMGNLMQTTRGLLWTDWEDAFHGPVEWDMASILWNARLLEADHVTADAILTAYREAGGHIDEAALQQSLIARAAVMSAWYPVLYPEPDEARRAKLRHRLQWLESIPV